jgi:hypothetical protein
LLCLKVHSTLIVSYLLWGAGVLRVVKCVAEKLESV